MRLTPSWARQNVKYHIERIGRYGYGKPGYHRYALCGVHIRKKAKDVDESAVPENRRCKTCQKIYAEGSR